MKSWIQQSLTVWPLPLLLPSSRPLTHAAAWLHLLSGHCTSLSLWLVTITYYLASSGYTIIEFTDESVVLFYTQNISNFSYSLTQERIMRVNAERRLLTAFTLIMRSWLTTVWLVISIIQQAITTMIHSNHQTSTTPLTDSLEWEWNHNMKEAVIQLHLVTSIILEPAGDES